jgi:hypothetical protein
MIAVFALILGATPEVWAETQGLPETEGTACSADALAAALRAQRPSIAVHVWHPETSAIRPPDGAIRVRLTEREGAVVLEVNGAGSSVVRTMPAAEGCERNVATAALIVDGALDELRGSAEVPRVDSLAPPIPLSKQVHLSALVGAGVEQSLFGFVPAFDVEGAFRYRSLQLTFDVDFGLAAQTGFSLTAPENGSGTFSATPLAGDFGAGFSPRLGPGRFLADGVFGLAFTFGAVSSSSGVFQRQPETTKEPFGALRLGYALDLPWGLFMEARAEERATAQASFQVVGSSFDAGSSASGKSAALTPVWTFRAFGFLGYHFF